MRTFSPYALFQQLAVARLAKSARRSTFQAQTCSTRLVAAIFVSWKEEHVKASAAQLFKELGTKKGGLKLFVRVLYEYIGEQHIL